MTAQVRSVTVRMDADIASYVAKMRLAGRETDKAFASSASNLRATNRELRLIETRLGSVTSATKAQSTAFARLDSRTGKLSSSVVTLNGNLTRSEVRLGSTTQGLSQLGDQTRTVSRDLDRGGAEIDRYSGRLRLILEAIAVVGPAIVPLGAATVPVLSAMVAGLGAAAGAIGVTLLATNGFGDALDALNERQLDPTTENVAAMRAEFERIGPDGERFVRFIDSLGPELTALQMTARSGLLPGVEEGITSLLDRAPQVRTAVRGIAVSLGDLAADAGDSLASDKYDAFFEYLENEAGPIISDFGRIAGNIFETIANVIVELDPATQDFTSGLLDRTRDLAEWSRQLGNDDGFQGFLSYIQESGPKALDFIGSLITSISQIVQAVAPVGDVVLPTLTAVLDIFGAIADSDLGTPIFAGIAALSVYNRSLLATEAIQRRLATTGATVGGLGSLVGLRGIQTGADGATRSLGGLTSQLARVAGPIAGLAVLSTGAADGVGLTNTASLALMGTLGGPWGAALGAAAGLTLDLVAANDDLETSIRAASSAGADDPLSDLVAKRKQLVAELNDESTLGNISSFLDLNDYEEKAAAAAIERLKGFIAARRELNSLKPVDNVAEFNNYFGVLNDTLAVSNSLLYDFGDALARANGFLSDRAALSSYEAALDAVNQSLEDNGRTLDVTTEKGRANRQTLDDIAASGLQVAETLKGDNRRTFLDGLRDSLRETAIRFGDSKGEAREYLRELGLIDQKKVAPEVDLDTSGFDARQTRVANLIARLNLDQANPEVNLLIGKFLNGNDNALAKLRALSRQKADPTADLNTNPFDAMFGTTTGKLRNLDGTRANPTATLRDQASGPINNVIGRMNSLDGKTATTYINTIATTTVRRVNSASGGGYEPGVPRAADGGTVPKTGLGYADRHFYLLADGEEIIPNRNGEADRYRAANGIPPARRLAGGGTTGRASASSSWASYAPASNNPAMQPSYDALLWSLDDFGRGLAGLSKQELKLRERDLDQTAKALERFGSQREKLAQKEVDVDKARLDTVMQAQKAFADQVSSLYDVDPFARRENRFDIGLPEGYADLSREEQVRQLAIMDQINASVNRPQSALSLSDANNARMERALQLYKVLRSRGFDGPAFQQLVGTADIETLEMYAAMPRAELASIERSVERGQRLQQQVGSFVGNAEFGSEVKGLRKDYQASVAIQKQNAAETKNVVKEIAALRRDLENVDQKIGDAVTGKVKDATRTGARR